MLGLKLGAADTDVFVPKAELRPEHTVASSIMQTHIYLTDLLRCDTKTVSHGIGPSHVKRDASLMLILVKQGDGLEADAGPPFSCLMQVNQVHMSIRGVCLNSLQVTECSYTIPPVFR